MSESRPQVRLTTKLCGVKVGVGGDVGGVVEWSDRQHMSTASLIWDQSYT